MKLSRRDFLRALGAIGLTSTLVKRPEINNPSVVTPEQVGTEEHPYYVARWEYADWSIAQQHINKADIPDAVLRNRPWWHRE